MKMGRSAAVPRIWLRSYPPGVPAEVAWRLTPSLKQLVECSCESFAGRIAFKSLGVSMRYRELDRRSREFAAWLQHGLRLPTGARVAVMLPNCLQYPVAVFGALRAGMTVVNVDPLHTAAGLRLQMEDCSASVLVALENFAHTVQEALGPAPHTHVVVTQMGDLFRPPQRWGVNFAVRHGRQAVPPFTMRGARTLRDVLSEGAGHPLDDVAVGPEDVAFIQYTGGTTGPPKGAVLTHGNLVANVEQLLAWTGGVLREGKEVVITALPLCHAFALTANLLLFVRLGGRNVLVPDPRDMKRFIAVLQRTPFTAITGVGPLFRALLEAPGFEAVAASRRGRVKLAMAGGMALQPAVSAQWQRLMGGPIIEGYGLSETSPIVCASRVDAAFTGRLGLPIPSTEVAVLDDSGVPQPAGTLGEIGVRGPQVMRGYWNKPQETAQVFAPGGWLRTGDIGRVEADGCVAFVDRKKDVIVVAGMKAFPREIEDAMRLHPGIDDVAAVGAPDPRSGEAVVLFVVRKDPGLAEAAVRAHAERHLAPWKRPRRIEFRAELPRTSIGKVLRRQLRDEAARHVRAELESEEREPLRA